MAEYISDNPQFIVNRFVRSGITGAIDGAMQEDNKAEDLVRLTLNWTVFVTSLKIRITYLI